MGVSLPLRALLVGLLPCILQASGCGAPEDTKFGPPGAITNIRVGGTTGTPPPTGGGGECKAVQAFTASAVPGMTSCAGCHGAAVNPKFLADATTNAAAACAKTLAYINKADVANSRLFTAAAGTNHSAGKQTIDTAAVTKWIEDEKK